MPNHVENFLYVIAPNEEKEKEIFDFLKGNNKTGGEDVYIDFNNITPAPPWIYKGNLGSKERAIWGKNTWYDWNIDNWGTKWNAYSQSTGSIKIDSGTVPYITFQTAWAAPLQVLTKLPYIFPDSGFLHVWADEDHGNNTGMALYSFVNGGANHIEWFSNTDLGNSLASYVWGMTMSDVFDYVYDDTSEEAIEDLAKSFNPLRAELLVESKLNYLVDNKMLFLSHGIGGSACVGSFTFI